MDSSANGRLPILGLRRPPQRYQSHHHATTPWRWHSCKCVTLVCCVSGQLTLAVRAGSFVFEVLYGFGIRHCSAKVIGRNHPYNIVYAIFDALSKQVSWREVR